MYYDIEAKESETVYSDLNAIIGTINALLICLPLWVLILLFVHWLF
jgi:hypothetical protein